MQPFETGSLASGGDKRRKLACGLVCDHKLAIPAGALAARIARLWNVDVHIFVERPAYASAPIMETTAPGVTYHYEELFVGDLENLLPDHPRFSRATWGRLFLPKALPGYDRILYCDIDVLPGPLPDGIETIDLPDGIGMVRDYYGPAFMPVARDKDVRWTQFGLNPESYFNSGALLINPNQWDGDKILSALKVFMAGELAAAPFLDQDFLNLHFDGKIVELSPNLNFQQSLMDLGLEGANTPTIRHLCHGIKHYHQLPRYSVSEITRNASAEFREMVVDAGLPLPNLLPYENRKSTTQVKAALRGVIAKTGLKTPKAVRMETRWRERRRRALDYLRAGVAEGRFADPNVFDLNPPEPRVRFNGYEILPVE